MTISCEDARRAIPWLLDDEIEPAQVLEIEEHLNGCVSCRESLERESALRETVRRAVTRVTAPPRLRRSIREALDRERRRQNPLMQVWPAAAAAAILLALIWKGAVPTAALPELDEAAQRHARDLPLDVVAAEVGPVQSYFNGKLPFSVQLPQVAKESLRQLGGRVTQLRNRDAAYVRYEMPRGRMALFVYQDPGSSVSEVAPLYRVGQQRVEVQRVRGFTTMRWHASGLVYSVVTDLPPHEAAAVLDLASR
jgi:mycothiol system anti-sigma-R factor